MINSEKYLLELNKALSNENIYLKIIAAGGFTMEVNDIRATTDIDGFYNSSAKIDEIIEYVGNKFGLNTSEELWINNYVMNFEKTPKEEFCINVYEYDHLSIDTVSLEYLIGMKLKSSRERDHEDVGLIINHIGIKDPKELQVKLKTCGFKVDLEDLEMAFGDAYGYSWLESYYHQKQNKQKSVADRAKSVTNTPIKNGKQFAMAR